MMAGLAVLFGLAFLFLKALDTGVRDTRVSKPRPTKSSKPSTGPKAGDIVPLIGSPNAELAALFDLPVSRLFNRPVLELWMRISNKYLDKNARDRDVLSARQAKPDLDVERTLLFVIERFDRTYLRN